MRHRVQQGEDLATIAARYGVPLQDLLDASENRSLWEAGRDEYCLAPGDIVVVPEMQPATFSVPTGQKTTFRLNAKPPRLELRLTTHGDPRTNEPYRLEVSGEMIEGRTDGDGWVKQPLPFGATEALLTLREGAEQYQLALRELDPAQVVTGAQARLHNLGFYLGAVDGHNGTQTQAAIERFQRNAGIDPTGDLDDATLDALKRDHMS